jgi:hypothetical protein
MTDLSGAQFSQAQEEKPLATIPVWILNAALVGLAVSLSVNIAALYITSERFFYFWDLGGYQGVAISIAKSFQASILPTLQSIQQSMDLEYNYLYTLFLAPLINLFGQNRLGYVLSVALVYQLPYAFAAGAIARKLIRSNELAVFWITVFLALLMPIVWAPTLRSYPDVGSALLITLAMALYLAEPEVNKWWQIAGIGILIGSAMLFRRHFTYSVIAFLVTISLIATIDALQIAHRKWKETPEARLAAIRAGLIALFWKGLRIAMIVGVAVLTLLVLGKPFLLRAITVDYSSLYTSYNRDIETMYIWFRWMYGRGTWILVGLGYGLGLYRRVLRSLPAFFLVTFGAFSVLQWMLIVRQTSIHYAMHTNIFILLGLSALFWTIWESLKGIPRTLTLLVFGFYIAANLVAGLAPVKPPEIVTKTLSAQYPPLVREDYNQVVKLVDFLRSEAAQKPVYVVDSSGLMNFDLLIKAEQALYSDQKLIVFASPQIDSRDYYPLEQLLQAEYLVVSTPFQAHLADPEQQRVVKVVYEAFTNNWEIAQDFEKLPAAFALDGGANLNIYQRTRATDLETAVRFFNQASEYIGRRPGSQPDWIVLRKPDEFTLSMKPGEQAIMEFRLPEAVSASPEILLLYAGDLPEKLNFLADWQFLDKKCQGIKVGLKLLGPDGEELSNQEQILSPPPKQTKLAFELDGRGAQNLLLSIQRISSNTSDNLCPARLEWRAIP